MKDKLGKIVSKEEFIKDGQFSKEQYEGLIVSSDFEDESYSLGVQLTEDLLLVVGYADEDNIREKIQANVPQIDKIQREYGAKRDLENYSNK